MAFRIEHGVEVRSETTQNIANKIITGIRIFIMEIYLSKIYWFKAANYSSVSSGEDSMGEKLAF